MAQTDDTPTGSESGGAGGSGSNNQGRRYKKRKDKTQERNSALADFSNTNGAESQNEDDAQSADVQEVRLVPLDVYEVDKAKMANVFGGDPQATGPVSSSLRLNPLVHDKSGTVVVPTDQAQRARGGRAEDSASQDSMGTEEPSGAAAPSRGKKGTYKRPKKAVDDDEPPAEGELAGPKINYSKNFRFKSRTDENGAAGGKNGVKKLTSFGVVMPARVKGNTIPKNQLVAGGGGASQYALSPNGQTEGNKADIEAARRRHEMRRRWRYVIILILVILFFGLILTVVLYFATQAP